MGVVLPGELEWVLELIGVTWPNVDEDAVRDIAQEYRAYAEEMEDVHTFAANATGYLLEVSSGEAVSAFGEHWNELPGRSIGRLAEVARTYADVLDTIASLIEAGKASVVVQLGILAAEVASAQVAAPFTLGLSELGALGATQATRLIVRELLEELGRELVQQAVGIAEDAVLQGLQTMAGRLVGQAVENSVGTRHGYDFGSAASDGFDAAGGSLQESLGADSLTQAAGDSAASAVQGHPAFDGPAAGLRHGHGGRSR